MIPAPCCSRSDGAVRRGLCLRCAIDMTKARKVHTFQSAADKAYRHAGLNMVGAARLMVWAVRSEAKTAPLNYNQGPGACAALIRT